MGLFYAFARSSDHEYHARYLIVFASREVADEWWRAVSSSSNEKLAKSIKRITPEFYTHSSQQLFRIERSTLKDGVPQFRDQIIFTLLNDAEGRNLHIIQNQNITDHISGNLFFIRSKADPPEYWYCPGQRCPSGTCSALNNYYGNNAVSVQDRSGGNNAIGPCFGHIQYDTAVYVSRTHRTQFRVQIAGDGQQNSKTVMIRSDDITITLPTSQSAAVTVQENGDLVIAQGGQERFKFGDLEKRFRAGVSMKLAGQSEEVREMFRVGDDFGEQWQLA